MSSSSLIWPSFIRRSRAATETRRAVSGLPFATRAARHSSSVARIANSCFSELHTDFASLSLRLFCEVLRSQQFRYPVYPPESACMRLPAERGVPQKERRTVHTSLADWDAVKEISFAERGKTGGWCGRFTEWG